MPYCGKCGMQVDGASAFCSNCGNSLGGVAVPQQTKPPKKRAKKGIFFGLGGLLVIVVGAVLFFCLSGSDSKQATREGALQSLYEAILRTESARDMAVIKILLPEVLMDRYPEEAQESISKNLRHLDNNLEFAERFGKNASVTIEEIRFEPWDVSDMAEFNEKLSITGVQATEGGRGTYTVMIVGPKDSDSNTMTEDLVKIDGNWYFADSELLEELIFILEDQRERE